MSLIDGDWVNSYCSLVRLSSDPTSGKITGTYSSHTGSTGTYNVVGFAGQQEAGQSDYGLPVAIVIQWRAINLPNESGDPSWHWASNFGGQVFPAQTITSAGQSSYEIPDTLEILNGLLVTSPFPGLAATAPLFWPQTLDFHHDRPTYCEAVTPATPIAYVGGAPDYVSGVWLQPNGDAMGLNADSSTNMVTGTYFEACSGVQYDVAGLWDTYGCNYAAPGDGLIGQSFALAMRAQDGSARVRSMVGYVPLNATSGALTWTYDLSSTPWGSRYTGLALRHETWLRNPIVSLPARVT